MSASRSTLWRLEGRRASFEVGDFRAEIDLGTPSLGLRLACARSATAVGSLLGVEFPADCAAGGLRCVDARARGSDLLAAFEQTPGRPIHVDAMWRALVPGRDDRFLSGVDLVVSVRTELLDVQPRLAVQSALAAVDAARLAHTGQFVPLRSGDEPLALDRRSGTGCLLFRTMVEGLSCVESVHPADFQESLWHPATRRDGPGVLRHRLFLERLEKGVILRARVRSLLLPRSDDAPIAAACYAAFAASEPPLGA